MKIRSYTSANRTLNTRAHLTADSLIISSSRTILFFIATALENGMPKHTKNPVKRAGNDTQGLACSGVTRHHHFRATRHVIDLGATSLKERQLPVPCQENTYIPCIIIREPRRADGRILHRSLTLSILLFLFLLFLINTFSGHFSFCTYPCRGHGSHIIGRKQAGREAWSFRTNFTFARFGKDNFRGSIPCPWCLSEYRRYNIAYQL
jgi:hypothetical protein